MYEERVVSGMRPTGAMHLGPFHGALKNWVRIQYDYECIFCIVDLHAVTVYQKPEELRAKILEIAALYLAAGIDPKHSSVMVQSAVPAHAELAWMLTCVTPVGWLERMTQFKAKSAAQESIGDGLLQVHITKCAGKADAARFYKEACSASHHFIYGDIGPDYFVFNNPESACRTCGGLGVQKLTHPELLVPDPQIGRAHV